MILLIDNTDSFVHNLARYAGKLGHQRKVVRNDAISLDEIETMAPKAIILSPGPCTPKEAGICLPLIRKFHETVPILGICLGHQCIGDAFGGRTVRSPKPAHGKTSAIEHNGQGLFLGLPSPLEGGRYHSLMTDLPANCPLTVQARSGDGVIMAMRHETFPAFGLQFHPESILTPFGLDILRNFMTITEEWNEKRRAA